MKRVLFLIDWFEPAFKAGGPIRSVANLAKLLQYDYEIYILTANQELHEDRGLQGIVSDKWLSYSKTIRILYASTSFLSFKYINNRLREINPDFVYSSGLYSRFFTIYPLLIKHIYRPQFKLIIGTHGMLKASALSFKPFKKKVYYSICNFLNLFSPVTFHVTDYSELHDVVKKLGPVTVKAIKDASEKPPYNLTLNDKFSGEAKLIFVGRIHPVKNLQFLLSILFKVSKQTHLTIVGPIEDEVYWNICKEMIRKLPSNIKVYFVGGLPHDKVVEEISKHHLFCLPTKGENFGHAIYEALSVGRPVLISDNTPWRNLNEAGAGWDISLDRPDGFIEAINNIIDLNNDSYVEKCEAALRYSMSNNNELTVKQEYLKLFS